MNTIHIFSPQNWFETYEGTQKVDVMTCT